MTTFPPQFILASQSPRRKALLEQVGYSFTIQVSDIDECIQHRMAPNLYSMSLAKRKTLAVARLQTHQMFEDFRPELVIGADTIVVCENNILGKPKDKKDAVKMLKQLSGTTHTVWTGYTIIKTDGAVLMERSVSTEVSIRMLRDDEINAYVRSNEGFDKAGGYAAQGIGSFMIESIHGSYSNVVGLPLSEVVQDFSRLGIFPKFMRN